MGRIEKVERKHGGRDFEREGKKGDRQKRTE